MEVARSIPKRRLSAGLDLIFAKMHPTKRNYGPRAAVAVPVYAPFRFLVAVAMALLIATVIASSTAHGMALGDALAQSTVGSPLRAVIPISTAPGELLQASCFRVVPAGDGSAPTVTAQVSLERPASAFRLVVTTVNPVTEPAIRFGIQAGCETMSRRDYVLVLNPQVAGGPAVAAVQPMAREPGQERPAPPVGFERHQLATGAASATAPRPIAARTSALPWRPEAPLAPPAARSAFFGGWNNAFWFIAAILFALCTIAVIMIMRQRHAPPPIPQWTRGRVTLLGDAAHPMLPYLGQGACQAIEDGAVLAMALSVEASDPLTGVARYERTRRPRASRVVLAARERGQSNHLTSRWAAWRRDLAIALRRRVNRRDPEGRGAAWLADYDASSPDALAA